MEYKVKVKPEDFQVREVVSLPITDKGQYGVFKLKKIGWNTVDLIKRIAKKFSIKLDNISYGGKKDRHGLTEQFITIKNAPKRLHMQEKNFSLKLVGFSDEAMQPRHIESNHFSIVIRSISKEAEEFLFSPIESITKYGFINYFDDQRFGSFDPKQGFIGEKIIKEHYNGALKIYLTHVYPEDKKEAKERKRYLFEHWGNWLECLKVAKTDMEKFAFNYLTENPKAYLNVLRKIPKEDMSMFFSAYQSFLWNETVRRILISILRDEDILFHRGIAGDYLFFDEIDRKTWQYLNNLVIPTASSKAKMPDEKVGNIYKEFLNERGIKASMFNLRKIRQAFFKSVDRKVLIKPEEFEYKIEYDEIYVGKRKLFLQFLLPRGSYATMLIKRIFAKKIKEGDKNALLCRP
ncbi:MAG: tRNA pseudouridine(13) synthase TruD [Thermodesulfovibrio sp.]|nr:tRNA pseudouridine(13) synthase TruD [Thermodesulfovibrio sp.]